MQNQVQQLDLNVEFKRQLRRYLRRLREVAFAGFASGILLLTYSHTTLPSASLAANLIEKLAQEIAVPDAGFLTFAVANCCVTLVFTGWPPAKPFRNLFAVPYLKFCFDLTGTAMGVFIPAIAAVSTPSQIFKAIMLVLLGLLFLFFMSAILWAGRYALSNRVQSKLQLSPGFGPYVLPFGSAAILLLLYIQTK